MTKVLGAVVVSAATLLGMALPAVAQSRATWIGGIGVDSLAGWQQVNQEIGPIQTAREYDPGSLPSTWTDSTNFCQSLPAILCVISYKTPDTNVNAFVSSIPANRPAPVFVVFYAEPEAHNPPFGSGQQFVDEYETQVDEIRAACAEAANCGVVKVAMIASTYNYQPGMPGADCSYIPPASYVDKYFADAYQPRLDGLQNDPGFQGWKSCTQGTGVGRGLTEYGLGTCTNSGTWTEQAREQQLAADAQYLSSAFPSLYLWNYYWRDDSTVGPCRDWQFPAGSVTANEWQGIEQGTVGS